MSKENVALFYRTLAEDKTLQEKISEVDKKYVGQQIDDVRKDAIYEQEVIPIAKEAGFEFTLQELKEYVKEKANSKLNDDELAAVIGGVNTTCACIVGGGGQGCGCFIGGGGEDFFVCVLAGPPELLAAL